MIVKLFASCLSTLLLVACVSTVNEAAAPRESAVIQAPAEFPSLQMERAPVMILGTFHFSNPNLDVVQMRGVDVTTPERQAEIEQVLDDLARYQPTRIAVEVARGEQGEALRADYARYLADDFTLTRSETHQLGFRLARRLGHTDIYPVNYVLGLEMQSLFAYAGQHEPEFAAWAQRFGAEAGQVLNDMQATQSIGANLHWMNTPESLFAANAIYTRMAEVGAGDSYVGADVAAQWYRRNINIFGNLTQVAEPGERVLLIIGQGHAPIIRQLVDDHPAMALVEPNDYLRPGS